MNKKTGLGKGLNALFADTPIVEENIQEITEENKEFIQKIKLINIEPNRDQPRRTLVLKHHKYLIYYLLHI